jgi:Uncharacterized protein conserved in bacteria (DUF2252)
MNISVATRDYEDWLAAAISIPLDRADLDYKHQQMADPANPFPFFRGTYYRWARQWPKAAGPLADAPLVLAVGDLHVENFGTWRDADGRLCWGVNDFDESDQLPYTNDLVRLATGVRIAKSAGILNVNFADACQTILDAYRVCLKAGGQPFVLEENHQALRALAMSAEREPAKFWDKLTKLLDDAEPKVPAEVRAALRDSLPADDLAFQVRSRPQVGMGSLGRPRYVALAEWAGGWVAREAKAAAPPATAWATGAPLKSRAAEAIAAANRSPDPFFHPGDKWIIRRLAPRCTRIELVDLAAADAGRLLQAMGAETANVHLGTAGAAMAILQDLAARPEGWLADAARTMSELVEQDWQEWRVRGA